mmetsp:Transcript_4667/g.7529  ORF Transcript_4667/g.7529 Transcript_4667/m.7529 type:complete len:135 (+) Transcript_4667:57-461(+)
MQSIVVVLLGLAATVSARQVHAGEADSAKELRTLLLAMNPAASVGQKQSRVGSARMSAQRNQYAKAAAALAASAMASPAMALVPPPGAFVNLGDFNLDIAIGATIALFGTFYLGFAATSWEDLDIDDDTPIKRR